MATATKTSHKRRPTKPRARKRAPLTRERVAQEALRLVDEQGLEALTMRALGKRLDVEAMSLYNHVDGRDGLEAELVAMLWDEVDRSLAEADDWKDALRSVGRSLRGLAIEHPHAFPLLLGASAFAGPMLRVLDRGLEVLREAGFDEGRAAQTINTVMSYAAGYGAMEISCFAAGRAREVGTDQLALELVRMLPPDTSPELARVAQCTCAADPGEQFEFGLEALLAGLDPACETIERG